MRIASKLTNIVLFAVGDRAKHSGFTLIELLLAVIVLGILLVVAVPGMSQFIEKRRVVGAAEEFYEQFQFARSESIKQSTDLYVRVKKTGATDWCVGVSPNPNCDCDIADEDDGSACAVSMSGDNVLKVSLSDGFPGVSMASDTIQIQYNNVRGTITWTGMGAVGSGDTQEVTFQSAPHGWQMGIEVSPLGQIRLCSPAGASHVGGYPEC